MVLLTKLLEFWRRDFNARYYLLAALFIALCIVLNYKLFYWVWGQNSTVERWIINEIYPRLGWLTTPVYMAFYLFPYLVVLGLHALLRGEADFARRGRFWGRLLFVAFFMSLDVSHHVYSDIAAMVPGDTERYWTKKTLATLTPTLFVGLPLLAFWLWRDRKAGYGFYGFGWGKVPWKPYLWIFVLFLPVLVIAAAQPQFTSYYPTLRPDRMEGFAWMPLGWAFGLYELSYASYFFWTELVMRGFLVLGLSKYLGKNAVLPMAALYAFRHFDKPWGETVSSVFGGYMLGAWALQSRSIWGGIFLHAGTAVGMDLLAWVLR